MTSTASSPSASTQARLEPIVNDMSIQMATVNGSGSQSANNIFTKTVFRMGVPVGPKNLFPSNIAGLPTWYTVRVNEKGYTARKKEIDMLVAMNEDTWTEDVKGLRPGAVLIANSDMACAKNGPGRTDLVYYPVPFTALTRDKIDAPKLRRLLTNMVYVGVLAELLGLDREVLTGVVRDNFKGKAKAVDINLKAIEVGAEYFKTNLKKVDPYKVEKRNKTTGKIVIDGNSAAAMGALMGGCTVVGWYPITPSSSLCETFIELANEYRVDANGKKLFADVQAEDELASAGIVLGAGWAGARSMTATAGPGISLMAEFIGLGYYAEVPGVFFNVQRVGPSTGLPTRTGQQDLLFTYFLSHGDTKHICLLPCDIQESYAMGAEAFDLAERFQTPIFVMLDLDLGMNNWMSDPLPYPTKNFDRGKVLDKAALDKIGKFERYRDVDGDGICYRTLPGTRHPLAPYFTRGSGHDEAAKYSESAEVYARNMTRIAKKLETARKWVPKPVFTEQKGAKILILAYGTSHDAIRESLDQLREEKGIVANYLRVRALPFTQEVFDTIKKYDRVYVVDQNRDGQMCDLLTLELKGESSRLRSVRHWNGLPLDARTVTDQIVSMEKA